MGGTYDVPLAAASRREETSTPCCPRRPLRLCVLSDKVLPSIRLGRPWLTSPWIATTRCMVALIVVVATHSFRRSLAQWEGSRLGSSMTFRSVTLHSLSSRWSEG